MRIRSLASAVALAVVVFAVPSFACFDVDAPPDVIVRFLSPTSAEVTFTGLVVKAAGVNTGDYCGVGFSHQNPGLITGIGAPVVQDGDDPPATLTEFSFASNANTTNDFTTLIPANTWGGFHTIVSAPVAGGSPSDLMFTITFPPGTTFTQLETELEANGLVGTDDADAAGNLLNTTQNLEATTSVIELADCYNDVIDTGEACDALNDLGCVPGTTTCASCTSCVPINFPNRCKSGALKQIGKTDQKRLKCYAAKAKLGMAVDPACLTPAQGMISSYWFKISLNLASCPLFGSFPADTAIDSQIDTLNGNLATAFVLGGTPGSWKCASSKFKAASVRAVNTLKCYSKAYQTNTPVAALCLSRVATKYSQAFARAELPGLCDPGNVGNAGAVATLVDNFVTDGMTGVVDTIPPP